MWKPRRKAKARTKQRIGVLIECPEDHHRSEDAIDWIIAPLEEKYDVTVVSVLDGSPKNGKAATKTEIKSSVDRVEKALSAFEYVVLVGNTPLQAITGKAGISKLRGRPIKEGSKFYLPMNNPGILRHDEKQEVLFHTDMEFLDQMIKFGGVPEEKNLHFRIVSSHDDVRDMINDLHGAVSYDIETTQLYPWQTQQLKDGVWIKDPEPKIVSLGFGTKRNQWCIPVNHPQSPWTQDEVIDIMDLVNEVRDDMMLITHNGKFDLLWTLVHLGIHWEMDFDTMLAHFLLDENSRHGLKYLAQVLLGAPDWEIETTEKQGMNVPLKKHCKYLAHDVYYTRKLKLLFAKQLKDDWEVKRVFDKIMMPCANLFVEVEYDGVFIDIDQFDEAEVVLREKYDTALAELRQWEPDHYVKKNGDTYYFAEARRKNDPTRFNWGSTDQLSWLLFDHLEIEPIGQRGKSGNYSCSESVIKRLDHPCTDALLRFRAAKQQLSFFIDGWKPFLHHQKRGFYLHPSFKLHGTVTGRLSCEHPNLQQVPRDPRIRSLISAEKGWTLIQCDLSQAELRIAAELAREPAMTEAFVRGIDVHWLTALREVERSGALADLVISTACNLTGKNTMTYGDAIQALLEAGHGACEEVDKEWKEYRKKAKAINFGYLYGMWWKKFKEYARDNYGVAVTDEQAEASRVAFFDLYAALDDWHKRQKRYARRHGYVKSLSGRKRRLPDAKLDPSSQESKAAQRQAINSPVQSFANEVNLMAAIQLRKEYGRDVVKICGTVHDAVLFRVRNDMVEEVYERMLKIMQWPELMDDFEIEMSVPIEADGDVGPWGKGLDLNKYRDVAKFKQCEVVELLNTKTSSQVQDLWRDMEEAA